MEEKIKVSLPKNVKELLFNDAYNFDFLKNDNDVNQNAFINTLIVNYYEMFSKDEKSFYHNLNKVLADIDYDDKEALILNIMKVISNNDKKEESKSKTQTLSFKPTKQSLKSIEYINNILVNNQSISSYYRKMFSQYAHKPQNEREIIIFKENYNLLNQSIDENLKVCLSLKNGTVFKDLSVYAIGSAKEELYNYVLAYCENGNLLTLRLAKVNNVTILSKKREIPSDVKDIFERQMKFGIQYPIYRNETKEIVVKLTKIGKDLFKRVYLYRPTPYKIEEDLYYFDCSYNQITYYFKRFGKEAIIISPSKVGLQMKRFYYGANKEYRNLYFNED